jgi:drug/metabolite transporter (DMT)-like permease
MARVPFHWPLAATVLAWGFNFVALKVLYQGLPAPVVALWRYVLMGLVLLIVALWRRTSLRYDRSTAARTLLQGFLALGVYMVLFLEGMRYAVPAEGAILLATAPLWTQALACAVGQERFSARLLGGAVLALVGVALVVFGGGAAAGGRLIGIGLLSASAFTWAVSVVVSRPLLAGGDPWRVLTLSMPGAAPAMLAYGLLPSLQVDYGRVAAAQWAMLAHVAFGAGVIGFAGFYSGVRRLGGPGAMLYQYLVPPTAAAFGWIVLGTPLAAPQIGGIAVVLAGVALGLAARRPGEPTPS